MVIDGMATPLDMLYLFRWGNNPKRETLKARTCHIICRGAMNSALIEFTDNGQREVISRNALCKHNLSKL